VLTVPPGLASGIIRYLWKNRVSTRVANVTLAQRSEFASGAPDGYLFARVQDLPERILEGFRGTPGLTLYRPISDGVAVEIGYRHPIELSSCLSLFAPDKLYLFSGQRDTVDVITGPVELVDASHLTQVGLRPEAVVERPGSAALAQNVDIPLKLAPSMQPPGRVIGTLIDGKDAMRLKQLVYLLPPSMLRGHRVVVTERGILIVAGQNVDLMPLGTLLAELTPGLLLPLGMDLVPRVAPDVLAGALGHGPGRFTVFPHEGGPFHVAESALQPLERRSLAALNAPLVEPADLSLPVPAGEPRVVNDAVGAFALWGFPAPPKPPAEK
jgi:FtsH ternary system domain X7